MASYPTSQVAELLGVSADTVRRWCDDGKLKWSDDGGRTRTIDGPDLARYLSAQAEAYEPDSVIAQSARNRFTGIITRVEKKGLVAVVEVHSPPHRVVSMLTREAAEELDLKPGDLATAVIKSTNVIVELPRS
ncbi:helix-turn-helix transcriptional regulator [soil metagenome]